MALSKNDFADVYAFLSEFRKRWYNIGTALKIKPDKLDDIKEEYKADTKSCLRELIKLWLKTERTWTELASALKHPLVDEEELAKKALAKAGGAGQASGGGSSEAQGPQLADLVDIIQKVSSQWRKIGLRTGQADFLDNYEKQTMLDNTVCCEKVFGKWISTNGYRNYPHSWQGLYDLLCDVEHKRAATIMADEKAKEGINITRR